MIDVIQQADAIYDFDTLDFDRDGTVPVHFVSISGLNGGVSGGCLTVTTTDIGEGGEYVKVAVVQQTRAGSEHFLKDIFYHESGHTFFSFPDMNHGNADDYNHYGIGGFDVMCGGGFNTVPSPYNPWFRNVRGWCSPTLIESNITGAELEDFQTTHNYYLYSPDNLPGNAMADQKFLISYHTPENQFYSNWPYADPVNGGTLIWHTRDTTVRKYDSYYDWKTMKLDIESAHGKFIWDEYSTYVENTGEENPLIGRDSLEIRKIALNSQGHWREIQGPYFQRDDGSASIFYTPDESGDFAFYTNPNSNWYVNSSTESYAQSIVSGFSMKNLRTNNGVVKADFYVNDITIPNSMTLTKGKWYFNGNLTIPSGKTLTIQPGTTLQFGNGKSLNVSGSLSAVGTSNNKITFDFVNKGGGNGVKFNYGSTGTLNNCNIDNAYYGVYISSNNVNLAIQHCNISDNNYGVYYSLDATTENTISNNIIEDNTYDGIYMDCAGQPESISNNVIRYNGRYGIYCYSGDPDILQNNISYNTSTGIYLYGNSAPDILSNWSRISNNGEGVRSYSSQPYFNGNIIENNPIGITGTSGSTIYSFDNTISHGTIGLKADYSSTFYSDVDAIYGYTGHYSLYADHNSQIFGSYDCFDDGGPFIYSANRSRIDLENPETCHQGLMAKGSSGSTVNNLSADISTPLDKELVLAFKYILDKKYEDAINIFNKKYSVAETLTEKKFLLSQLAYCYRKAEKEGFIDYLNNNVRVSEENILSRGDELYAFTIELENIFLIKERNYTKILENLDFLRSNFSDNDEICKNALFGLIHLKSGYNNDISSANSYLEELKSRYPGDELTLQAMTFLGEDISPSDNFIFKQGESFSTNIPEKYELLGNYPNPFNPSTTISYTLPFQSSVKLIIYDIMGSEVKSFNVSSQSAGYQSIVWDGKNELGNSVASGIYLYRISIKSLEGNETFVKTAKLMLMK